MTPAIKGHNYLANPNKAWRFAFITTVTSVLGGLLGYTIGAFAIEAIAPWLQEQPLYWNGYQSALE